MKLFSIISGLFLIYTVSAQECYWQQAVEYKMNIDFDIKKHQFTGTQQLKYTNNSPDSLSRVYYHLYYNAFQPGSMMDVRSRTIVDPDKRVGSRISELSKKEIGYQKISSLKLNGEDIKYQTVGTILEVQLNNAIAPGATVIFDMEFEAQVPAQIRRTGRNSSEGVDYSMTQWYPKMCEYDKEGWHPNPYVGREFHGVWGNFDVTININKNFVLGATGELQNPNEIGFGYESAEVTKNTSNGKLSWHWKAEKVHDFAWAADTDYAHDIQTINNGTKLHFLYLKNKEDNVKKWKDLQPHAIKLFEIANKNYGVYPYSKYSVIQGGDGGMEYPMMTLVTSKGDLKGLIGVTIHEAMHSWYQGIMATNEAKYAWMDEGFTSYAEHKIEEELFPTGKENILESYYNASTYLMLNPTIAEPLTTHADFFNTNRAYGISAYARGSVFLQLLSYIIGEENLQKSLKEYYSTWKFKHPTPQDFIKIAEKHAEIELDWYLEQYVGTLNYPDYGIDTVEKFKKGVKLKLKRIGKFPLPIDVTLKITPDPEDPDYFELKYYTIPLQIMRGSKTSDLGSFGPHPLEELPDWPWVNPTYEAILPDVNYNDVKEVYIGDAKMWDVDKENNSFKIK